MAYDPARDTCASCIFHVPGDEDDPGECHRLPPSYIARLHVWSFASVTPDNSCGEHDSIISDDHAHPAHCD